MKKKFVKILVSDDYLTIFVEINEHYEKPNPTFDSSILNLMCGN
jgi:hypothetical protein